MPGGGLGAKTQSRNEPGVEGAWGCRKKWLEKPQGEDAYLSVKAGTGRDLPQSEEGRIKRVLGQYDA